MDENGDGCWARNMGIETDLMIQPVPSLVQQGEWRAVGPPFLGGKAAEGPPRDLPWKHTFSVLLNSTRFARGKSMAFITSQSR